MQRINLIILLLLSTLQIKAQTNLVPNPSFNFTIADSCGFFDPFNDSVVKPWHKFGLSNGIGISPSFHTCTQDYLHHLPDNFDGYEYPHSGNSCIALSLFALQSGYLLRHYNSVKLLESLKKNRSYCSSVFLSMMDSGYIACNDFGFYFSTNSINESNIDLVSQNIFPQVENNPQNNPLTQRIGWTEVKGVFTANGTEQYLTIGNFKSQATTDTTIVPNWTVNTWYGVANYLLDDVSVVEVRALTTDNDDTTYCLGASINKTLSVHTDYSNIHWSTGDTTQSITVNQAGKYWVTATNACGTITDTFSIKIATPNDYIFSLGKDTLHCNNFVQQLSVNNTNLTNYQWSNGDTNQSISVNQAGKYWVTATNECGTFSITDTVSILQSIPNDYLFSLGNDTVFCKNISKQLIINNPKLYNYLWSTGDTTQSITFTLPLGGSALSQQNEFTYWASALSECGLQTDTIIITKANIPNNIILQIDTTIYVGDTITINAIDGLEQYKWSATNGVVSNQLLQSTTYTNVISAEAAISISAYTQDGCTATDSISIKTIAKPVVELPLVIPNPQIIGKGGAFKILNLPPNNSVNLYDAMGQIVFEQYNYTNNFNLDVIAEGIYFYKIVLPNGIIINGKLLILEK